MSIPYPAPPLHVPKGLSSESKAFKRNVNLALLSLSLFCLIYLLLTGWFCYTAYLKIQFVMTHDDFPFSDLFIAGVSVVLSLFMLKSLFIFQRGEQSKDYEITREQQPELFTFIEQLAKDTKAPKPHKVYLSHEVNAAVFYDLSLLNMIFPSRKNLIIGLGLVNVLNLSELKAVLAHEFGHFAQGSMAIGRWVWNLQMIARQLIYHRDWLDKGLDVISGIDIRIAWIGWLLRIIIWSIRSCLDTIFSWVVIAERALSREMEYQADLVAVEVSGSDALIHALHKLRAADEANAEALGVAQRHFRDNTALDNLFPVQSKVLALHRQILNDAEYGVSPVLPAESPESHRVFTPEIGQPPQMWATHPHSHLREENAKKLYIPCEIDTRSAWTIFREPQSLGQSLTQHLLTKVGLEKEKTITIDQVSQDLDERYNKSFYNPRYRGAFLARSIVRGVESAHQLIAQEVPEAAQYLGNLYPESLEDDIESLKNYNKEIDQLEAIKDGFLVPQDGVIRYREGAIKKKQIPTAIEELSKERDELTAKIDQHDLLCRTVYHSIALQHLPDSQVAEYHRYLLSLHHYAEHTQANLLDLNNIVENTYAIIVADGNVSSGELKRLIKDCNALYSALSKVYKDAQTLTLDEATRAELDVPSWQECLGEFTLPAPNQNNIQDWLQALDGWLSGAAGPLSAIANISLELLLRTEESLHQYITTGSPPAAVPAIGTIPEQYATLLSGQERPIQKKLNWWDSFQTATGLFPTIMRFLVSSSIVAAIIWASISNFNAV